MEIWKTLRVFHIPTPPATTTNYFLTKRYTNIPRGTKDRSAQPRARRYILSTLTISIFGSLISNRSLTTELSQTEKSLFSSANGQRSGQAEQPIRRSVPDLRSRPSTIPQSLCGLEKEKDLFLPARSSSRVFRALSDLFVSFLLARNARIQADLVDQ